MKKKIVSKKTLRHASRGDFYYPHKFSPQKILTMKSGGHGEENISFLKKQRIAHTVDTRFSNGVRFGSVSRHRIARDRRQNGHAWFPSGWTADDIRNAGQHVASLKRNRSLSDGQRYSGRYKGVSVGIIVRKSRIKTVFPLFEVNKHARKKAHILQKREKG